MRVFSALVFLFTAAPLRPAIWLLPPGKLLPTSTTASSLHAPAHSHNELRHTLSYVRGRHEISRDLLTCFRSWADENDLTITWTEREVYLKLSEFACSNPSLLRASTHGINGKGYIMCA